MQGKLRPCARFPRLAATPAPDVIPRNDTNLTGIVEANRNRVFHQGRSSAEARASLFLETQKRMVQKPPVTTDWLPGRIQFLTQGDERVGEPEYG
jgi:hypothetical protein